MTLSEGAPFWPLYILEYTAYPFNFLFSGQTRAKPRIRMGILSLPKKRKKLILDQIAAYKSQWQEQEASFQEWKERTAVSNTQSERRFYCIHSQQAPSKLLIFNLLEMKSWKRIWGFLFCLFEERFLFPVFEENIFLRKPFKNFSPTKGDHKFSHAEKKVSDRRKFRILLTS